MPHATPNRRTRPAASDAADSNRRSRSLASALVAAAKGAATAGAATTLAVTAVAAAAVLATGSQAFAASGTASVTGAVVDRGAPVPDVDVTIAGNNFTAHARTDARGRFSFVGLPLGGYTVTSGHAGDAATATLDLSSDGADLALTLAPEALETIGATQAVRTQTIRGSGTDVTLSKEFLDRSPQSGNLSEALIQLPGAVRGANGVVHLDGDHGVIDYLVDGVPLPQALNREIGSEIDPTDISFIDVIEGAYPAQYGLRFGSVLNITTRAGTGPAGFDGFARGGSFTNVDQNLGYHAPLGANGGISLALRNEQGSRGLDSVGYDDPHDRYSNTNQFLRLTLPRGKSDFTDVTLIHAYRAYQIPNDVANGEPATTDDDERQEDTFVNVQFRHALGSTGSLSFGPALKVSRIRDFGDPTGDFAYGSALNVAGGGSTTDCANGGASDQAFSVTSCAFSLNSDKTATDYIAQADYVQRLGSHEIRAGANYDAADVRKHYAVTLQPNDFLAPLVTPNAPNAPYTVHDDAPNLGQTYQSYVQDAWAISPQYRLDTGLRYDYFTIASTEFGRGFGSFSPRVKLTRSFGARANVYAYLGRFFEPFSFENVSPQAAYLLNLPLQESPAAFDLKPERDTQLELGGHLPVGDGELGLRVWQKNANDLIDDTQVGVTLLHQDINYTLGRLSQEALYYQKPLARQGRAYVSVAHTVSLNKGCETQLLAPCFGSPTDYTPADHNQFYSATAGLLVNDRRYGWLAVDGEYGSGLSSDSCPDGTPNCARTPHTTFAAEKGFAIGPGAALTLRVRNLFNDRYDVTLANAQGDHVAPPRTYELGVQFGK